MKKKSFIKFNPVRSNSEVHNLRKTIPKYCIDPSNKNISIVDEKINNVRQEIEKKYQESVGQKIQKKATPIREAVVLLKHDKNKKNIKRLKALTDRFEECFGIRAFQWHIHNDEGFIDEDGTRKYNYHAHIVFNWTDKETGKSFKLNREDMSKIGDITSEVLGMERGEKGAKNLSLNHHQYRMYLTLRDELTRIWKRKKLTKEEDKGLRGVIRNEKLANAYIELRDNKGNLTDKEIERMEGIIAKNSKYSYFYAKMILKAPFPKGEKAINTNKKYSTKYIEFKIELESQQIKVVKRGRFL